MGILVHELEYPMDYMGFTVYPDHCICNTCHEHLEGRGIMVMASHWVKCAGKAFTEALHKEHDPLTVPRVDNLINIHLK